MIQSLQKKTYRKHIGGIAFLLWLIPFVSTGQIKFSASANEPQIGKNDLVQIQFKIENAQSVKSIDPPSFDHFFVVSGPNQETGSVISNGNRSFYAAISFILRPKKTGKLTIAPATAIADGKKIKSNPVSIVVSDQNTAKRLPGKRRPSNPFSMPGLDPEPDMRPARGVNDDYILAPGEDVQEKIKKNLFVKLQANKTDCYVGEPIVVSFKLYTRLLSKTNITDAPSFNGFSVSEMDVNDYSSEEKIDGKLFNCYTLRKVQLFPTQPGTFTISPLQSVNKVNFLRFDKHKKQEADPFWQLLQEIGAQSLSSGGMTEENIPLESNSLTIRVKPLPEENKPKNFKGAVGKFSLKCSLQKEEMAADDAGNLTLTISGSGNMAMVNEPEIKWPAGIDSYDAKIKEQLDNRQVPVTGTKTFNIPFTVARSGDYSLPPVHFSWFDPELGRYDSTKTEPITFYVSRSNQNVAGDSTGNNGQGGGWWASASGLERAGVITLAGGLVVLFLFVVLRRKSREDELTSKNITDDLKNEPENEFVIPFNPLEETYNKLASENPDEFYKELEHSLKKYLSAKLKIPQHELSTGRILEGMDKCNVGVGTTHLFEMLTREIELGLYAKSSHSGQMKYLYEKSAELIALLDKQICNPS